jgi:hypothetical protein
VYTNGKEEENVMFNVPGGARCGVCVTTILSCRPWRKTFMRARYPQSKKNVNLLIDTLSNPFRLCSEFPIVCDLGLSCFYLHFKILPAFDISNYSQEDYTTCIGRFVVGTNVSSYIQPLYC